MAILFAARQPCDFPTNWAGPELAPEGAPGGNSCQPGLESARGHHLCLPWSYNLSGTSAFCPSERGNTGLEAFSLTNTSTLTFMVLQFLVSKTEAQVLGNFFLKA